MEQKVEPIQSSPTPGVTDRITEARSKSRVRKGKNRLKRDPVTEPSVIQMFRHRMKREGRSEELNALLREVMNEGLQFSTAMRTVVMPKMGFVSDEAEIRIYREHQAVVHHLSIENEVAFDAEEERARTDEQEYEAALLTLPSNAPKAKELEWIEAHPAMMRQSRLLATGRAGASGKPAVVLLTARDILNAPHGVCPSRSAANQLQHWVNHSQKFFEQIMSEAKKKSGGDGTGGDGTDVVDEGLEDLDASLAEHGL